MREIKFRAWDATKKRFGYCHITGGKIIWPSMEYMERGTLDDDSESVWFPHVTDWQQYTGLKDKNGKEIYEGDILGGDFNRVYSEVFFNGKRAQFMARSHISTGSLNKIDHVEVIGNIYENPELLK